MNKILLILCLWSLFPLHSRAQPLPHHEEFRLQNNLKVFFAHIEGDSAAIQLFEQLKVDNEVEHPGIKDVFFTIIIGQIQAKAADKNIKLAIKPTENGFLMNCENKDLSPALQLISETIQTPHIDKQNLEKIKRRQLEKINHACSDVVAIAQNVTRTLNYKNHPYGIIANSFAFEHLTAGDLQKYYEENFAPSVTRISIVGNSDFEEINHIVNRYFAGWKDKTFSIRYIKKSKPPQEFSVHFATTIDTGQAVLVLTHPVRLRPYGPHHLTTDLLSFVLQAQMDSIFGSRGVEVAFRLLKDPNMGQLCIRLRFPARQFSKLLPLFDQWIKDIEQFPLTEKAFLQYKKQWIQKRLSDAGKTDVIAAAGIDILRFKMAKKYYQDSLAYRKIRLAEIRAAARIFIHPQQAYFIAVAPDEYRNAIHAHFPKQIIHLHDCLGKEQFPFSINTSKIDAQVILKSYLDAIGDSTVIDNLRSISYVGEGQFGRKNFLVKYEKKTPGKLHVLQFLDGKLTKEIRFDGTNAYVSRKGEKQKIPLAPTKEIAYRACIFPEREALNGNFSPQFIKTEAGSYVIEFNIARGVKRRNYYDKETGLKTKSVLMRNNAIIEEQYEDYLPTGGILFPTKIITTNARRKKIKYHLSDIQLNPDIPNSNFDFKK